MFETKICTKCGIEKEATLKYFYKRSESEDGLRGNCIECFRKKVDKYADNNKELVASRKKQYADSHKIEISQYKKTYREDNKIKASQYSKIWRENNKEILIEQKHEYYDGHKELWTTRSKLYNEEHKEEIAERNKMWRKENKGLDAEKHRQYAKNNPEIYRINWQKRRAKKLLLLSTLTIEQWETIKDHFNNKCCYCGKELSLAQEHFIPLSKGGEYTLNNIIPCCKQCNSSKHNYDFFEWYPKQSYYNKKRETKILKFLNYQNSNQQLTITL